MYRIKRVLCLLLAVVLLFSLGITAFADKAKADEKDTKIYFDTRDTGWRDFGQIGFYVWEVGGDEIFPWGSKMLYGTDEGNGIWSYDVMDRMHLEDGRQYGIVFFSSETGGFTYNLLFDTTCLGDTAYCDGMVYENPEDSNKASLAAFWRHHDRASYGPELKVTSIGNVAGIVCAADTSRYQMFVDFLKTKLANTRMYSGKDDQTLLDDTARALDLSQEDIAKAVDEADVEVEWQPTEEQKHEEQDKRDPSPDTSDRLPIVLLVMVSALGLAIVSGKNICLISKH